MYFLAGINTKWFWRIPKEKYFAPLKIINLFVKSFLNPLVDIALTFSDSPFISSKFFSLLPKSIFFTKLVISSLLAKFSYANLAVRVSYVNLLNSWLVIYLSSSWSIVFSVSVSLIFVL